MAVSYLPCFTPLLLVGIPLLFLARSRRAFVLAATISGSLIGLFFLSVFAPGWLLMARSGLGDPAAEYELARWTENHRGRIGAFIIWPYSSDVLGGYARLERAAAKNYPPALWMLGVRLKYGIHVPEPPNWTGPGGNVFAQPERGQKLIDHAISLGFRPPPDEEGSYWMSYRR